MTNKTDTGQDRKDSIHGGTMKDKKRKRAGKDKNRQGTGLDCGDRSYCGGDCDSALPDPKG